MNSEKMDELFIVIVDDDPGIVKTISTYLVKVGYRAKGFPDAESLFKFLEKEKPDLIILDLMLPDTSGFEICKNLKETERFSSIPIIILSGKTEETDKISGLEIGADDYIVKPFSLKELHARIKAVLRRPGGQEEKKKINVDDIMTIDSQRYEVKVEGEKVDLTPAEFRILEFLASRRGHVFTRDRILDYMWGAEKIVIERTIDVHIRHLREKLGKGGELIKNVRGIGYKLEQGEEVEEGEEVV